MSEPDAEQAEHERKHSVRPRFEPLAILGQIKRLQAEGRKSGVAAADPKHEKLPERSRCHPPPLRPRRRGKESDDERARDVYGERPPGKRLANPIGDEAGCTPPGQAAQTSADKNPQRIPHKSNPATIHGGGRSY